MDNISQNKIYSFILLIFKSVILLVFVRCSSSDNDFTYQPTQENLQGRQEYQEARFGLFIHWGLYSEMENGEWIMEHDKIKIKDYEPLADKFNPTTFDPKQWVKLAKDAGMKYITVTTKHHDGFAMYDSKISDYDIIDRTPYKKDIIKMLAEECRSQGMKLFLYHSQLDWHHPDYFPRGNTGQNTGRSESGNWANYLAYMNSQLTEILTQYGPISGIWLDGYWDKYDSDWHLDETYNLIHKLQPSTLIGNNHHLIPRQGEDFQIFEKDLPGNNTSGLAPAQIIGNLPKEICETINKSWGYNKNDLENKSMKELIQYLIIATGSGCNFLLDVGPMSNGQIQSDHVELLSQIGEWMKTNGETIYSTEAGPIKPGNWGASTQKGNKIYLHVFDLKDEELTLMLSQKILSAKLFNGKIKIEFSQLGSVAILNIPKSEQDDVDTIIELEYTK